MVTIGAVFNVPSSAIEACYAMNTERTEFDTFFLSICEKAKALAKASGYDNYYVLGVRKGATDVLYHELAHGLFATHADYRQLMETAIASSECKCSCSIVCRFDDSWVWP